MNGQMIAGMAGDHPGCCLAGAELTLNHQRRQAGVANESLSTCQALVEAGCVGLGLRAWSRSSSSRWLLAGSRRTAGQ
jgi:hypothetical protein